MNTKPTHSAEAACKSFDLSKRYLNFPISQDIEPVLFQLSHAGATVLEFPLRLGEGEPDYWVFLDVGEFHGQTLTLCGAVSPAALDRVYQSDEIEGQADLYREPGRPQFHFTVKRGWNNDVNGPIFYNGQYHLFWQAFVFGVQWDTGFMYWGHAVSPDLLHWTELPPALKTDKLGAAWSGTALIDHKNAGGWGKDALVLFYTAFDRHTSKQVQCVAYSTDRGETFTHFEGNPVLDTNSEVGSVDTRDPKVFWHEPTEHWVMVLFEKDGLSFFTSTDLKSWTRKSHFQGLFECPDLFELPIDGDSKQTKWVLHGGSASYYIGNFDGETFTPQTGELRYAEGANSSGADTLYAAESFAAMPDGRCVQMAWGRIEEPGMPFNQMILFPTEMRLAKTNEGVRLLASPIHEISRLHRKEHSWRSITADEANERLRRIPDGPLHVRAVLVPAQGDEIAIHYGGSLLATIAHSDLDAGRCDVEILIDKAVAEIFVDQGRRYIVCDLSKEDSAHGLEFGLPQSGSVIESLAVYEMASIWSEPT